MYLKYSLYVNYRYLKCSLYVNYRYLKCSPYVNKMMHKNDAVFSFTDFLKSFLPKKSWTPKIAMFGPGLESELTSGLVRKILYEDNRQMERTGLVSGQFEGKYSITKCLIL